MKWTLHLYRGQKFHDDTEITAEDVQFSVERLIENGEAGGLRFQTLHEKRCGEGDRPVHLSVQSEKPVGFFMSLIPLVSIVNSKLLRQYDKSGDYGATWLANNDAGSGAYRLKKWDPAVGFVAEAWPGGKMVGQEAFQGD